MQRGSPLLVVIVVVLGGALLWFLTRAVEVPDILATALGRSADARRVWERLSPGKRRGLAYRVQSAKTDGTRVRRVNEIMESLAASR